MELDRYIWSEERGWEVGLKQLWAYLAQYCYLPRLLDRQVLVNAVRDGVGRLDAPIAYATGKNEEGYHTGIVLRRLGTVFFDDRSLLVHPDHVVERPKVEPALGDGQGTDVPGPGKTPPVKEPEPREKVMTRYYGRVVLDPQRANHDMGVIVEQVVERLTSQIGCDVEISVKIEAKRPDGFEESTIRTVSENSRTLKFEDFGFEEV
jgi:hypothetical protein